MKASYLRRWCKPRTILVISNLAENPAHTLEVVTGIRGTGARVFLVQLPGPAYTTPGLGRNLPFLLSESRAIAEPRCGNGNRQAFLWAEILSEVTVLKNTPIKRIPALADSLGADLVVLTAPEIGFIRFCTASSQDVDLYGSIPVPILIFGARMKMSSWNGKEFRRILLPISFGRDLGLQLRVACRFARRNHGRLTVLRVFENGTTDEHPWERTPVAVEARLPISELKHEGILCPMEIAICEGYPARKILSFNEQKPHDLIIIGGSRMGNFSRGPGHNIAESVMSEAFCPVLILGRAIASASAAADLIPQLTLA